MKKTANKRFFSFVSGGPERIRTAVEAFAELCLATRPQDPFLSHFCSKTTTIRFFATSIVKSVAKIKQSKEF